MSDRSDLVAVNACLYATSNQETRRAAYALRLAIQARVAGDLATARHLLNVARNHAAEAEKVSHV